VVLERSRGAEAFIQNARDMTALVESRPQRLQQQVADLHKLADSR
jgi:hypothetical protein